MEQNACGGYARCVPTGEASTMCVCRADFERVPSLNTEVIRWSSNGTNWNVVQKRLNYSAPSYIVTTGANVTLRLTTPCVCPAGQTMLSTTTRNQDGPNTTMRCRTSSCSSHPCLNGGTCHETPPCADDSECWGCTCAVGWAGPACNNTRGNQTACSVAVPRCNELEVLSCSHRLNESTCIIETRDAAQGASLPRCVCPLGFHAASRGNNSACERVDVCSSRPCGNGGSCRQRVDQAGVNQWTCSCAPGYYGTVCNDDIDECYSQPCAFGTRCEQGTNSFHCDCNAYLKITTWMNDINTSLDSRGSFVQSIGSQYITFLSRSRGVSPHNHVDMYTDNNIGGWTRGPRCEEPQCPVGSQQLRAVLKDGGTEGGNSTGTISIETPGFSKWTNPPAESVSVCVSVCDLCRPGQADLDHDSRTLCAGKGHRIVRAAYY